MASFREGTANNSPTRGSPLTNQTLSLKFIGEKAEDRPSQENRSSHQEQHFAAPEMGGCPVSYYAHTPHTPENGAKHSRQPELEGEEGQGKGRGITATTLCNIL